MAKTKPKLEPVAITGGESRLVFSKPGMAHECLNFVRHPDGGIVTIEGPALLEPDHNQIKDLGWPHGIFHGVSFGGTLGTLFIRAGTELLRHVGWDQSWEVLVNQLTDEQEPMFPDQFAQVGENVVWTNGIDRPRIITPDARVYPLGFNSLPPTPMPVGPHQPDMAQRSTGSAGVSAYDNNELGYSWWGELGTVGGLLEGQAGSLLRGAWVYVIVLEDALGNLSQPSAPSAPVILREMQADPWKPIRRPRSRSTTNTGNDGAGAYSVTSVVTGIGGAGIELDDLLRSALVTIDGAMPNHTRKIHLYRTPDLINAGGPPQLLTTHHSGHGFVFPDEQADAVLGPVLRDTVSIPLFRLCCSHNGRLIMANSPDDPSRVWASEPGFAGTLLRNSWCQPDPAGTEITGVASYGSRLFALCRDSIHDITDFWEGRSPLVVSPNVGCAAPSSIAPLGDGRLGFLSRRGFHALTLDGGVDPLHPEHPELVQTFLNQSRLRLASAAFDRDLGEYRCGVARAGQVGNQLIVAIDAGGVRRLDLSLWCERLTSAYMDGHSCTLVFGVDPNNLSGAGLYDYNVWMLDRATISWVPAGRIHRYGSAWESISGVDHIPVRVRELYVCTMDSSNENVDLKVWINGEPNPVVSEPNILNLIGSEELFELPESEGFDAWVTGGPFSSGIPKQILSSGKIGTIQAQDPRVNWRKATLDINDVRRIRFQLQGAYPKRMHLLAYAWRVVVPPPDAAFARTEGLSSEADGGLDIDWPT